MEINLDNLGFLLSGIGTIFFFFIYACIFKTTALTEMNGTILSISVNIRECWMKNISGKTDLTINEQDKTDWTKKKHFAIWVADKGSVLSFAFVAAGFILQLISKFI